jgi:hypothetical protein
MKRGLLILVAAALLALAGPAQALDFDFSGAFTYDNDVVRLGFSVGADSTVTVFSSSWDDGGFDPMLGIWTAGGSLMSFQDDGWNVGTTNSNGTPYTHGTWDSYYNVFLTAGSYIATITQFSNFNNGSSLADGFRYDNNPNFTYDLGYGGATQPYFNGVWDFNDPRSPDWTFHLLNVAEAEVIPDHPVPEPCTMLLLGGGLLGLAGLRRKRS